MFGYEYDSLCPVMPGDGSLTTVAAEKNIALTSAELAVVGVRPNPFNPSTKILFNLPSTHINTEIKMTVYDMAGRIVNRISKSFPTHGSVFIEWNGKDAKGATAASGVYFASITSANAKQSLVKLTLMK